VPITLIKRGNKVHKLSREREFSRLDEKAVKYLCLSSIRLLTEEIVGMGALRNIDYGMCTILVIPSPVVNGLLNPIPPQSISAMMSGASTGDGPFIALAIDFKYYYYFFPVHLVHGLPIIVDVCIPIFYCQEPFISTPGNNMCIAAMVVFW
jgi:hypothetical protein